MILANCVSRVLISSSPICDGMVLTSAGDVGGCDQCACSIMALGFYRIAAMNFIELLLAWKDLC